MTKPPQVFLFTHSITLHITPFVQLPTSHVSYTHCLHLPALLLHTGLHRRNRYQETRWSKARVSAEVGTNTSTITVCGRLKQNRARLLPAHLSQYHYVAVILPISQLLTLVKPHWLWYSWLS